LGSRARACVAGCRSDGAGGCLVYRATFLQLKNESQECVVVASLLIEGGNGPGGTAPRAPAPSPKAARATETDHTQLLGAAALSKPHTPPPTAQDLQLASIMSGDGGSWPHSALPPHAAASTAPQAQPPAQQPQPQAGADSSAVQQQRLSGQEGARELPVLHVGRELEGEVRASGAHTACAAKASVEHSSPAEDRSRAS
jgi:hypothetical protein